MTTPTEPAGATPPEPTAPAKTDPPATDGLGDAGKKALAAEREARKALETQTKELQTQLAALAPLSKLAEALGVKPEAGKTDVQTLTDQVSALQRQAEQERLGRLRAEVAAEKKLPPAFAARLQGTTAEELAADADLLIAALPNAPSGTPAPDPSQGARGGAQALEAALKAAQDKGDAREAIRIKNLIAAQKRGDR
jgi:hypothetical protein